MPDLFTPREPVTRHRAVSRDENGQLPAGTTATVMAIAVAPGGGDEGGGSERPERARSSEVIAWTVYFPPGTDIVNTDELTVRGKRFRIVVNDWHLEDEPVGGLEVLCVRGQG